MKYAVWEGENCFYTKSLEGVKGAANLPAGVPQSAIVIDAQDENEAVSLYVERDQMKAVDSERPAE